MRMGKQTWVFDSKPVILASSAVGGPFEGQGNLAEDFDILNEDIWLGQDSLKRLKKFCRCKQLKRSLKAGLNKEDINILISGDLINQIISSTFAARDLELPYIGIYGACSTSMQGLALAALMINCKAVDYAIAASSSHNAAAEKQFRYPTEYGTQKPPTAQWTVTGAGAVLLGQAGQGPR